LFLWCCVFLCCWWVFLFFAFTGFFVFFRIAALPRRRLSPFFQSPLTLLSLLTRQDLSLIQPNLLFFLSSLVRVLSPPGDMGLFKLGQFFSLSGVPPVTKTRYPLPQNYGKDPTLSHQFRSRIPSSFLFLLVFHMWLLGMKFSCFFTLTSLFFF